MLTQSQPALGKWRQVSPWGSRSDQPACLTYTVSSRTPRDSSSKAKVGSGWHPRNSTRGLHIFMHTKSISEEVTEEKSQQRGTPCLSQGLGIPVEIHLDSRSASCSLPGFAHPMKISPLKGPETEVPPPHEPPWPRGP